jgi:hypothetical protein
MVILLGFRRAIRGSDLMVEWELLIAEMIWRCHSSVPQRSCNPIEIASIAFDEKRSHLQTCNTDEFAFQSVVVGCSSVPLDRMSVATSEKERPVLFAIFWIFSNTFSDNSSSNRLGN